MAEGEATVSINGGPAVPVTALRDAARRLKGKASRARGDVEVGGIAADRLRSIIERIERLDEERKALSSDISDIFFEAKGAGFDVKVLRQVIRLRKLEPAEVEEQEALLALYRRALGM